jgi:hypothetical protein
LPGPRAIGAARRFRGMIAAFFEFEAESGEGLWRDRRREARADEGVRSAIPFLGASLR